MGLASGHDDDALAGEKLVAGLYQLNKDLQVPSPKAFGIEEGHYYASLDTMVDQALASGSPNNNPLIPKADNIKDLYKKIWV
jgi:alcohol dehydrogenase class IV